MKVFIQSKSFLVESLGFLNEEVCNMKMGIT